MALEVHLTDHDVGLATAGLFNENKWEEIFRGLMTLAGGQGAIPGFVLTGLDQNAVSGLDFTFNGGDAVVGGFIVKNFPQTLITMPASQVNIYAYLELTKDGGGDISGAQITIKTDNTLPTNPAILLRYLHSTSGALIINEDRRPLSARVYTTKYEGDTQSPRTWMLGFTPRVIINASEDGTIARFQIKIFVDGVIDFSFSVSDSGSGATASKSSSASFINGGIKGLFNTDNEDQLLIAF